VFESKLRFGSLLTSLIFLGSLLAFEAQPVMAEPCGESSVRGNIEGENDRVRLSLGGSSPNCIVSVQSVAGSPQPYATYEIACSSNRLAAAEGLCSTTPCRDFGRFFAYRTLRYPDGRSQPAGFQCVSLNRAIANPGITVAQVFEAVRRVKLPGGEIGVAPEVRGLANLESYFWVQGANQASG
jgi:hypothetical protein